jgi:hypothetical protein
VIAFPFEVAEHSLTKDQVSGPKLLEVVRFVQQHWVASGKREELCAKPWLRHNVSNTVHVKDTEWDEVARYIYEHREDFVGVSLLSDIGDKAYFQAPFVSVLLPEEQEARYGAAVVDAANNMLPSAMAWFGDVWTATSMARSGRPSENENQELFLLYFHEKVRDLGIDAERFEYALKDAWAYARYVELREKMVLVDFAGLVEETDVIDHQMAPACAGGSCSVTL